MVYHPFHNLLAVANPLGRHFCELIEEAFPTGNPADVCIGSRLENSRGDVVCVNLILVFANIWFLFPLMRSINTDGQNCDWPSHGYRMARDF
jgi:hypothetical protein